MSPSGWLYLVAGSQNVLAFIEVPDWTLWRAFQSMMQTKMRALSISPLDAGASFATLSIGFIVAAYFNFSATGRAEYVYF